MNAPRYVQIDTAIFANPRVGILLRKHGAAGLGVFVYYLVELGRQAGDVNVSIDADSVFCEGAACALGIDIDDFNVITSELLRIGLLCSDGGRIFSAGFNKRTGKEILANIKRSETLKSKTSPESATKPKKPKSEPKPDPETQESARVRSMIADLEDEFGAQKISNLSNAEATKIVEKYGDHAPFALRIFYLWKVSKGKRVKSDYLSLLAPWVQDEVAKERQRKNGNQSVPTRKELLEAYK
jgi:hypothetical protein